MLLDRIDADAEPYRILIDCHHPLRLVLTSQGMQERGGVVEPLWHRDAGDDRSFAALINWVAYRRDRWQEWGALAVALGRPAFYQHMRERMEAEPIAECVGTLIHRMTHPAEVLVAESMHGTQGLFTQPLHVHRFASAAARDRFYDWLHIDDNLQAMNALAQLGYNEGALALGATLDEIAASQATGNRAGQPRRGKATARSATAKLPRP